MTRLDDLLGQLTIDVPEAPTVDDLRSRAGNRHRRSVPMVAALIGMVVISAVLVQLIGREGPSDDLRTVEPTLITGPRSFEISIRTPANPLVRMQQFDSPRWDWISDDFATMGIRVDVTSLAPQPLRLTAPIWDRRTDGDVLYLGNQACDNYFVCLVAAESATLVTGASARFWVYVQPRLAALDDYSFSTQFRYENLTTGETGTIPVDVGLTIWEPQPGTEPPTDSTVTVVLPPPPTR